MAMCRASTRTTTGVKFVTPSYTHWDGPRLQQTCFWRLSCKWSHDSSHAVRSCDQAFSLTSGDFRIIHFILFVYACIATHKWRKAKKLSASERRNIELQYNRSPEEHLESQPPAYTPSAEGSARTPRSAATSEENNPFKDTEATAESNPFHDDHVTGGAVKYA